MSTTWTPELKESVIAKYQEAGPTAENSTEIIKDIAEEIEVSPNGVRMVLVQAGVYVKKDPSTSSKDKAATSDKPARVSKEASIAMLRQELVDMNKPIDDDILSKLTGKAAVYFLSVIKA